MKQETERPDNLAYRYVDKSAFGYLSHMPIIIAMCAATSGPIIELGAGFGSTLALHGMCAASKRHLLTVESDKTWIGWLWFYSRSWHKFRHVSTFVDLPEYKDTEWELAIVDHGILVERGLALSCLSHVPIIVAHDTCHEALNYTNDGKPQVLDSFKYRYDSLWTPPQTSILSNSIDIKKEFGGLGL